jgi:hypothetical protein
MKKLVDDDRGRARSLLEAYPQLIGALIEVQVRLTHPTLFYVISILFAGDYSMVGTYLFLFILYFHPLFS